PVEVREKVYFSEQALPGLLKEFREEAGGAETAILSTCNRTEVYAAAPAVDDKQQRLIARLAGKAECPEDNLRSLIYTMTDEEAARRLFMIAAGLDSLVVGEGQVLGQVRRAGEAARNTGTLGKVLGRMFRQAVSVGKRARAETAISQNAASVSSAAVELGRTLFGNLERKTALIMGAGKVGELSVKHLRSAGLRRVLVVNRTYERAVELADRFEGKAVPFEEMDSALAVADVVISSTGSEEPIVDKKRMKSIMRMRKNRPVFIVDIAVPRDFDPLCGDVANCFLYNIDDLKQVVERNIAERRKEIVKVERIIDEEMGRFNSWFNSLEIVPVLTSFRERVQSIRDGELERFRSRLDKLPDDDRRLIDQLTQSIVQKVLHEPTVRLKGVQEETDGSSYAEALRRLFDLDISSEEERK
ncbi:MAG: glutamyl-tRNA reductase, partial [bacterium]